MTTYSDFEQRQLDQGILPEKCRPVRRSPALGAPYGPKAANESAIGRAKALGAAVAALDYHVVRGMLPTFEERTAFDTAYFATVRAVNESAKPREM